MANSYTIDQSSESAISFTNQGQTMWGMLHMPASSGPHPAVLMLHGLTGDKTGSHRLFVHAARAFAAHGIASLRFDMRGSGDSEGEFQDISVAGEISDAQVALDWLTARPDIDPSRIALLGLSLGGLIESSLAGKNADRLQGLVFWAAAANAEVFMHMAERTSEKSGQSASDLLESLIANGYLMLWGHPLGLPFIQTFFNEQPLDELNNYRGQAIIVHTIGDPIVPVTQADAYAAHFGDRAVVHKLEDNTHTFETPPTEQKAIDITLQWLLLQLRVVNQ